MDVGNEWIFKYHFFGGMRGKKIGRNIKLIKSPVNLFLK